MQHITVKTAVAETTELGHFAAIAAANGQDRRANGSFPARSRDDRSLAGPARRFPSIGTTGARPRTSSARSTRRRWSRSRTASSSGRPRHPRQRRRPQAWRSVKKNRVGLSFGYLTTEDRVGNDGTKELVELDLFEITLTPTPANADTRVLETKALGDVRVRGSRRKRPRKP